MEGKNLEQESNPELMDAKELKGLIFAYHERLAPIALNYYSKRRAENRSEDESPVYKRLMTEGSAKWTSFVDGTSKVVPKHDLPVWEDESAKKLTKQFIKELLEKREQFNNVLQTEKGSLYFVASDGSSLRVKHHEQSDIWEVQPIAKDIIFLDPDSELVKKRTGAGGDFLNKPLPVKPVGVGTLVLEFNYDHEMDPDAWEFDYDQTTRILRPTSHNLDEKGAVFGLHTGHAVSKILK